MNIKKIIKEEIDNFDWVNEIETPLSWLIDNFGDLKPLVTNDKTFYVDDNNQIFFYYYHDNKNGGCYISNDTIWEVLITRFGVKYEEIRKVITTWLDEVYGITGRTPRKNIIPFTKLIGNVYGITEPDKYNYL
jgi:hypothetical protein